MDVLRLNSIMFEAEKFDVCYDADEGGEDPYCMAEDLGEESMLTHSFP